MDIEKLVSLLQEIKALSDECLASLDESAKPRHVMKQSTAPSRVRKPPDLDFDKPIRPFIKQYSKDMSGPERFTLLLARLVGGDLKKQVQLKEVERHWNTMTSLMDRMEFNQFFPSQAKDRDWVESKKRGSYNLRPNWKEIFK